jgi:hypothetical protein
MHATQQQTGRLRLCIDAIPVKVVMQRVSASLKTTPMDAVVRE